MTIYGPYPARCVDVHDGDTITLDIDLGFAVTLRYRCRIFGINAPELNTDPGKAALTYALTLIKPGDTCHVESHGWDKYGGRFDGTIKLANGQGEAIALGLLFGTQMLTAGQAKPVT